MKLTITKRTFALALLICAMQTPAGWAQPAKNSPPEQPQVVQQPDSQRTREELSALLDRYPPELRRILALDPALLGNQAYLAPYPALVNFLAAHPEVARNPGFYVGSGMDNPRNPRDRAFEVWNNALAGLAVLTGIAMAIGLIVWLIRMLSDYRRWSRLAKVQTDVHTKLIDRFTANDDLLAYIQSPAGSRFLQSSPITLDAAPRSMGAPLGRIMWAVQGGVVLLAVGIGFWFVSGQVTDEAAQPLHALGILGIALGLGFVLSAIISFVISRRLGLLEPASRAPRSEPPEA